MFRMFDWIKRAWNLDTVIAGVMAKLTGSAALWIWWMAIGWHDYAIAAVLLACSITLYCIAWLFVPPGSSLPAAGRVTD